MRVFSGSSSKQRGGVTARITFHLSASLLSRDSIPKKGKKPWLEAPTWMRTGRGRVNLVQNVRVRARVNHVEVRARVCARARGVSALRRRGLRRRHGCTT